MKSPLFFMSDLPLASVQATLNSLSSHIAILNSEGTVIAVNDAWRRFATANGYHGEDFGVGSNYLTICESAIGADSEEAPMVVQGLRDVISEKRGEFYLEYPCHSPEEPRWFSLRATRFWDGDAQNSGNRIVVTHENISTRKLAELRLHEEVELTETLYHIGQVVAGELDLNEIIRVVTEAALELSEASCCCFVPSPDSQLGLPFAASEEPNSWSEDELLTLIEGHFNDILHFYSALSSGALHKAHMTEGVRLQLKQLGIASALASPIVSRTGERLGLLFLASDLPQSLGTNSERIALSLAGQAALALENARLYERARRGQIAASQSEKRYRFVTEMMPQIVWVTSPNGYHEYFNRRWFDYTGQTEEESLGGGWAIPLHPDDVERSQRRWEHSLQTGELYEIEYRFQRFDGVYRWFLGRAAPMRDDNGQITRWFGTCTDIDDQKHAESERLRALEREERARHEAEAANRLKDEFLAVVSHELRTPLTPILGWVEMLRDEEAEPAFREQAYNVIERNARAQSQIVNDLLDVSRITSGKMRLDVRAVDLNRVLYSAIQTCESAAVAKGVEIVREFPDSPSLFVGDADRLQQVAWNLISNAIKFTPRSGKVTIRLEQRGAAFRCSVTDTGSGIASEFLPYVFDRFRQADTSSTRRFGGLGLGLSIVKHLVEQHGGEVGVASPGKDQGTTFTADLPIAPLLPAWSEAELSRKTASATARVSHDALEGTQILVVDDEADAREMLAQMLRRYGAKVEIASSASLALERLQSWHPDAVISDIGMPGDDGYWLVRRLRELPPEHGGQTPIMALTAYARAEDKARALGCGFGAYLSKPVAPDQLVATIKALTERKSHETAQLPQ